MPPARARVLMSIELWLVKDGRLWQLQRAMHYLSVVIPAYNESARISATLEKIKAYLDKQRYASEIIVVDDGSTDDTVALVEAAAGAGAGGGVGTIKIIKNTVNSGKGLSVKRGVMASTGEYVLFTDADLSTPIEELEKLLDALGRGADIAVGSRALATSDIIVPQPLYRQLLGRVFNLLVRALVMRGFVDTQCGFKCFSRVAAGSVFAVQTVNGFAFDVETLYVARLLGLEIEEVPVRWINSPASKVGLVRGSMEMFWDLLRIKLNIIRGVYDEGARQKGGLR